jgi:hypothetical protein
MGCGHLPSDFHRLLGKSGVSRLVSNADCLNVHALAAKQPCLKHDGTETEYRMSSNLIIEPAFERHFPL